MEIGKIVIKDKVYFEYYLLEKPTKEMLKWDSMLIQEKAYNHSPKAYEASKQLIEVSNVFYWKESKYWTFTSRFKRDFEHKKVINSQRCKAEVNGKTCKIVELIK